MPTHAVVEEHVDASNTKLKIHLIGIGGTGMGALAGLLVAAGHEVRGSDSALYPPMSTLLAALGVPVLEGFGAQNLRWGPDRVVVGNVCRRDHPEATAAQELGLRLTSFPPLLSELFLADRHSVVVAGTHGKTTTSTLMAQVLTAAQLDPGYLIGGVPQSLERGYRRGSPPYFVVEGDEYDCAFFDKRPKFVHYRPQTVILTGVELDHTDIYPDMAAVERAFALLVAEVPPCGRIIACADSEPAVRLAAAARCPVETYSAAGAPADWRAEARVVGAGVQELRVSRAGQAAESQRYRVAMTGAHNAANTLAVIAAARLLGVEPDVVTAGLEAFRGVRRRQEVRGVAGGVTVIDDFAHHPTAIRATLAGLRGVHGPGRLVAVFEPRSATTKRAVFQDELPPALGVADRVVLADLHAPDKVPLAERLDPARVVADLRRRGVDAALISEPAAIAAHLAPGCAPGDTIVVMSSGAFGGLVDLLLDALGRAR